MYSSPSKTSPPPTKTTKTTTKYPTPQPNASLILSFNLQNKTTLIIGSGTLAASRAFAALEANSEVVVLCKGGKGGVCEELGWREESGEVRVVDVDGLLPPVPPVSRRRTKGEEEEDVDVDAVEYFLDTAATASTTGGRITFVCITDTILCGSNSTSRRRTRESAEKIYNLCRSRNILVNTTDIPSLCDFSFTATHRFDFAPNQHNQPNPSLGSDSDSSPGSGGSGVSGTGPGAKSLSSLQIGVTTNGKGCRLAGRIKREIVSRLPKEVGGAVERIGRMRELAKEVEDKEDPSDLGDLNDEDSYDNSGIPTPNRPVPSRTNSTKIESTLEKTIRRMKWVAQISEYYPLSKISNLTDSEMKQILSGEPPSPSPPPPSLSLHALPLPPPPSQNTRRGRILLVGSGPGHPSLLTLATHTALTSLADLVLSDKLVPESILSLIPPGVEIRIAKKFPGNAEGAQCEMMEAALEAARRGLTVVRLKQGDPTIYGRAGEELLFFRTHGYPPLIIPGISSSISGPTFFNIPITQRGASESFIVCTGVGRKGKSIQLPGYERGRTLVILMGVARLSQVVGALVEDVDADADDGDGDGTGARRRAGPAYPLHTPIAIIERASMPDQRIIESTLQNIVHALENAGDQRPPGMIIVGWSILSLWGEGDVGVLDEGAESKDLERVGKWLGGDSWRVREGLDEGWEGL